MKIIEIQGSTEGSVIVFTVSKQTENVKFLDDIDALKSLRDLYEKRFHIRKRKYIEKELYSREFGKTI